MKIPLFYCNINNFGDKLNESIYKEIIDMPCYPASIKSAFICGIGSLLDMCLFDGSTEFIKDELCIFSTGFGFEEGGFFHNKNIILPEKLARNVKCYALRGKLTLSRMQKLLPDINLQDVVIGDGGLLASELVKNTKMTMGGGKMPISVGNSAAFCR